MIGQFLLHQMEVFILRPRSLLRRYCVSILIVATGLCFSWLLQKESQFQSYSVELASVVVGTVYGGFGPGLLCALIAVAGVDYLFLGPLGDLFQHRYFHGLLHLLVFMCTSLLLGFIVAELREAYREVSVARCRAEHAIRARDNILAVVSHDLKNPLANISLNLQLMRKFALTDDRRFPEKQVTSIERSVSGMGRLIRDLLDSAKLDAGDFVLNTRVRAPGSVAEQVVGAFALLAQEKGVKLVFNDASGGATCELDADRLDQALSNIVSNALKFTPSGGRVSIEARARGDRIELEVRDTGPGIAPENIEHLFDRFWQERSTSHLGTGLGLYIARGIVRAHGGEIRVRSTLGQGSAFLIDLPCKRISQAELRPRVAGARGPRPG